MSIHTWNGARWFGPKIGLKCGAMPKLEVELIHHWHVSRIDNDGDIKNEDGFTTLNHQYPVKHS